jgi:hypothetical protein
MGMTVKEFMKQKYNAFLKDWKGVTPNLQEMAEMDMTEAEWWEWKLDFYNTTYKLSPEEIAA